MKSGIIGQLGEVELLLPALIAEGLAANDRVKARLSLLQAALRHAQDPSKARFDLAGECRAAGLDPAPLEALVNGAHFVPDARITAPGLDKISDAIFDDVDEMARAVKAGEPEPHDRDAGLERLSAIKAAISRGEADTIAPADITRLTGMADESGDGLHRLVMDLHKALNRLAAAHAEEVVAGAHAYGLLPQDRPAVEAFMRGLESTAKLKLGHPGLGTTAMRSGGRLTIQNDIGETDAHVIVIGVEPEVVTVTYTDVHLARAKFFTGLFQSLAFQWSGLESQKAAGLSENGTFYLVTGRCRVDGETGRDLCLETIGAGLVFLIDWNKARKALRTLVQKADAVRLLAWSAQNRHGHRAFLELGGSELVAQAVRNAAPKRIRFGESLDQTLGHEAAVDFLKSVLRISAEALLHGESPRSARDHIEAEVIRHLARADGGLLAVVVRQAGLARELAVAIAHFISGKPSGRAVDRAQLAERARWIEEKADKIAIDARNEAARLDAAPVIERLVNRTEEAIDEFEQAAFIASLLDGEVASELRSPLAELAALAVVGVEAAAAGVAAAIDVPEGHRIDFEDALAAVERLIQVEHEADAAERSVTAIILRGAFDLKTSLSILELSRAIERAADRLAGVGHLLRAYVLADLST
ncbi:MAG TPA: hypothetical protein VME69_10035 [Methylocella sp.]|nr:hypothetical protein [Methylocella sp.]